MLNEFTERCFPGSWLVVLTEHVSDYVVTRDADQKPVVPDRLRLRKLPQSVDFDALRDLIEKAMGRCLGSVPRAGASPSWTLATRRAWISCVSTSPSISGKAYPTPPVRVAIAGGESVEDGAKEAADAIETLPGSASPVTPRRGSRATLGYEQQMRGEEKAHFPSLRNLPSPRWRAWFLDTSSDLVAIHEILNRCGVEATGQLGVDLFRRGTHFDMDVTHMTLEELISRIEVRHRFFTSALRAARDYMSGGKLDRDSDSARFSPRRSSNRPPAWDEMMGMVARLKRDNMRWKEIKDQVEIAHRCQFDSDEALRKHFERWQKGRETPG